MRRAAKPNIAICYDFDGTLIHGNMQQNSFLPVIGTSAAEFWSKLKERARQHDMDEVLAYMQLMIEGAARAEKPYTRDALVEHGKKLDLFPGVGDWFGSINEYCRGVGATVERFVISSGLQEMIEGSGIAKEFVHIFASGFSFDPNGVPNFAPRSVNYTTKTQYLFRINKGIVNSWDNASGFTDGVKLHDEDPVPLPDQQRDREQLGQRTDQSIHSRGEPSAALFSDDLHWRRRDRRPGHEDGQLPRRVLACRVPTEGGRTSQNRGRDGATENGREPGA